MIGADIAKVTVFGDQLNDVGMFEAAGRKLAVSNAHETVKKLADDIIGANDEDGVADYLAALIE